LPRIIETVNGSTEIVLGDHDFAYVIERYIGSDAAAYFLEILEDRDNYREEIGWYDE
jgi:hypothetical protein